MSFIQHSRNLVIDFNNRFPFDKIWREKHGVALFSEKHLKTSQIDIYLEWLEGQLFEEFKKQISDERLMNEEVKKGKYIKEAVESKEQADKLFSQLKKIDFGQININMSE